MQLCFDFYMIEAKPENLIGDRAYDSDPLDAELRKDGIEMIAPHRGNRSKPPTQDRRRLSRYMRRALCLRSMTAKSMFEIFFFNVFGRRWPPKPIDLSGVTRITFPPVAIIAVSVDNSADGLFDKVETKMTDFEWTRPGMSIRTGATGRAGASQSADYEICSARSRSVCGTLRF